MRYLVDTHAFIWFISGDRRLSARADSIIKDRDNEIYLSAASVWEIAIKKGLGRLSIDGELEPFLVQQLAMNGFLPLAITIAHAAYMDKLPAIHKDPFDRMLIAQSLLENMRLISGDSLLPKYAARVVW